MIGKVFGIEVELNDELAALIPVSAAVVVRGLGPDGNEKDFIVIAGKLRHADAAGMHLVAMNFHSDVALNGPRPKRS